MNVSQPAAEPRKSKPMKPFSYVNRKGDTYFLRQGETKLGKPRYFFSRSSEGSLKEVPAGYEVTESINAVVSLSRPRAEQIPAADLEQVRTKVQSCRHLAHHRVESKGSAILIYAPVAQDVIERTKPEAFSLLASFKPFLDSLGRDPDDFLAEVAEKAGMTLEQFKQIDAQAAQDKRGKFADGLRRTMQYDPVMRFVLDKRSGEYRADRRSYRDERDWLELGMGSIKALASKYVRHIGKESFFELF